MVRLVGGVQRGLRLSCSHKPTYYDYRWFDYAYDATVTHYKRRSGTFIAEGHPSCFRAGTKVWTETGLRPIETIEAGDRVLSQDPDTGELALKLVIQRTVRPPAEIVEMRIDGERIECTKGHPFWVNGMGWRMAKLIEVGDRIHTLGGAAEVEATARQPYNDQAFNLVVDDFGTYFVGKTASLVHDNTYRRPTTALVPGLVPGVTDVAATK